MSAIAADLDEPGRRAALAAGIAGLRDEAAGLPHVSEALHALLEDADIAWRAYACAVLADELGADG